MVIELNKAGNFPGAEKDRRWPEGGANNTIVGHVCTLDQVRILGLKSDSIKFEYPQTGLMNEIPF